MKPRRGPSSHATRRAFVQARWVDEPLLEFAGGSPHVDQKTGLARFGPASLGEPRHPAEIRLGFIGSGPSIASARTWFEQASAGVSGEPEGKLPDFPGCAPDRGFFSSIVCSEHLTERITTHDMEALKAVKRLGDRFDSAVRLVSERLEFLSQQDDRPDVIVLALPNELLAHTGRVRYTDPELGVVCRNFRRALKAELMRHRIATQILLQRVTEATPGSRNVDHASRVAWNLITSLYFKAGGVPWRPIGLRGDTCYVGISFHRPLGSAAGTLRSSVAQAFDELGTGLVLRGPDFPWNAKKDGASPHLDAEAARSLLELVLKRYERETKRLPRRVVVHKTSRFFPAEHEGFRLALKGVAEFDLVAVSPTSEVRLVRAGKYPPLRGTLFTVGATEYLYTTGYIHSLEAYPHGHVPSPIQIADHHGDTATEDLAREILLLTKMNWNSAGFAGAMPITIRFSRRVGEIMREVPADREPEPQFKYYT
jgi:hypothetical protein